MAIRVDLNQPLISKLSINSRIQIIEYESLPTVCFNCGTCGHVKDTCPKITTTNDHHSTYIPTNEQTKPETSESVRPWMLVDRRQKRSQHNTHANPMQKHGPSISESNFNPLFESVEQQPVETTREAFTPETSESFRPWMLVDRRQKRSQHNTHANPMQKHGPSISESNFNPLFESVEQQPVETTREAFTPETVQQPSAPSVNTIPATSIENENISVNKIPVVATTNTGKVNISARAKKVKLKSIVPSCKPIAPARQNFRSNRP
ncbi:uncharacterized protein LOC120118811 [Hibiscus syriacus]|uniref:uncharacterized protein LOC120118811 n=1 Tax=Hibiscus syriacus TaxID=106335 RepID=UPI001923A9EC|nr:uncharacterized protein LOC120118811 [Hibiscus syriacus]